MRYRGRVSMTLIGIIFILIWDIVYYTEMNLQMDAVLNIMSSCILLIVLYWAGGYLDKKSEKIASYKDSKDEMKIINEEMQHVLQSIEEVVFHTDAKGCFQFLNRSWAEFSGYSVKESLQKNALHFISLHERHEVLRMIRQHIDQGKPKFKMDFSYQKRDGTQRWGEMNIKLNYDQAGRLVGTVGTISDVTDRIHTEEELKELNETLAIESQKLSVAGQLAAGIAHEVRNPLTSINGFLQLIRDDADEKTKDYLEIIFSEIKRIELVLSELLILAKPQTVSYRHIDVKETLVHVQKLLNTNAILYNIDIRTEFSPDDLFIKGDENQLKQVFINLIKNGIESMPRGGTITLKGLLNKHNKVVLTFEDQGVGMNRDILDKLGEPFFTTKTKGTGLGLTICLRILRDHRADVRVNSEPGEGTKFFLSFESAGPPTRKKREKADAQASVR